MSYVGWLLLENKIKESKLKKIKENKEISVKQNFKKI